MTAAGTEDTASAGQAVPAVQVVPGGRGEDDWRRLDRRTVAVTALVTAGVAAGGAVPAFLGLAGAMAVWQACAFVLAGAVALIAGAAAVDHVRWRRTRYRIGPERAELHTGLLLVKRRSLPRERIRSVDLTAHPLLRVLGLVKVRMGTGEHTGGDSTLELDPVTRAEGERLRRELLDRTLARADGTPADGELAALDPAWIRYAPVSFVAPLLGGAAAGAVLQVSDWFGAQREVIDWIGDRFRDTPLVWTVLVLVAAAAAAGVVGALGLWVEMWWNYRLEREPGGTLRVRRGLLTARSLSIEERRLRGVELVEPLGARLCGAARVDAIATGLTQDEEDQHADHRALLPAVPRALAHDVAARVLREAPAATDTRLPAHPLTGQPLPALPLTARPLTAHPRAARTRRLRRAVGAALAPALLLAVLAVAAGLDVLAYAAAGCALLLTPVAVAFALDAYRALGHGISGGYLLTRSGTVRRATVALQRGGVIGWTVRQSWLQRRAGLVTLTATTAAGAGAYHVHDADGSEALRFAADAVPELLEPFLQR
ncbi:PH domain-containing protein [Streptomyces sp. NPDC051310]|uniref:PH domain-containing protein n=1 Tax=Streptomyces sp. NPDC051310 TaxID=3365649 RepID=UPI0037919A17